MKRLLLFVILLVLLFPLPVAAQDQLSYTSQPDEIAIFLNNVAYVKDSFSLPGGTSAQIVLPDEIFQETLLVRENGQRVARYRLSNNTGLSILSWDTPPNGEAREVVLEYLIQGIGWQPKYDMAILSDQASVRLNFFAEITNFALPLENTSVRLIAGQVSTSQPVDDFSNLSMNQALAPSQQGQSAGSSETGAVTIQHIYETEPITTQPGDLLYAQLLESELPARRVLLWNAQAELQAKVIYKVLNESAMPLPAGIVRNYENDLFIGSDPIELTPIEGEGSVTVGNLQSARTERGESVTSIINDDPYDYNTLHNVTLTLTNFGSDPVEIEVVEIWSTGAGEFVFSDEPTREPNNVLRWVVTVAPGETETITYEFKQY